MAEIFAQDVYLGQSTGVEKGMPEDDAGDVLTDDLGAGLEWTSRWYTRSPHSPRIFAALYADQTAAVRVEVSWDKTTIHNMYEATASAKTLGGASKQVAELEARILAPHFRFVVENTSASPFSGAKLWGLVSTP